MRIILILLLSFFPFAAHAKHAKIKPPVEKADNSKCHATPSVKTTNYPGQKAIINSNDLTLPEGKAVPAYGQKVYIYGRVLDKNCVPVSDAIVEIWQVNPSGKKVAASLSDRLDPYPVFTGSGRAVTDNLGRFNFITLFPGIEQRKNAPHIYFMVTHEHFPKLNTEMFFSGDNRNFDDKSLLKMPQEKRERLLAKVNEMEHPEDGIAVKWDVILNGMNDFRKF